MRTLTASLSRTLAKSFSIGDCLSSWLYPAANKLVLVVPTPRLTASATGAHVVSARDLVFVSSQVELVAESIEGMEKLRDALGKSRAKSKRDDAKLHVNLAEVKESINFHSALQIKYRTTAVL